MNAYTYTVVVTADRWEHAEQVMIERLGVDEEYGFNYSLAWRYAGGESDAE